MEQMNQDLQILFVSLSENKERRRSKKLSSHFVKTNFSFQLSRFFICGPKRDDLQRRTGPQPSSWRPKTLLHPVDLRCDVTFGELHQTYQEGYHVRLMNGQCLFRLRGEKQIKTLSVELKHPEKISF